MEEFRNYNERIEVSNLGNVKKDGQVVKQYKDEYYYYILDGRTPIRVHTMVGECFPEICGEHILFGHYHHINHNQLDNRAENIRCISNSEHKRLHQVEGGVSVAVKAYNKKGEFVGRWDSMLQAANATGQQGDIRHLREVISGGKGRYTAAGLYWFKENATEEYVQETIKRIETNKYRRKK